MPIISVIVPVYKVEKYLNRCINSILNQSYENFELILVDDGSPDNCPNICDEWVKKDKRISVIHQKNQGLSSARNTGIRKSKGKYLTFVDSDDWIASNMLEVLLNLILKHDADISICDFVRTDDEKREDIKIIPKEIIYNQSQFMDIILKINSNRTIHYAWGKLYKREIIDSKHYPVGMLNEDVEGMFKAVARSHKIVETNRVGYYYFENSDSITRVQFGENFLCLTEVWKRILSIADNIAPKYKEKVAYNLKRSHFTILVDSILYGNKETDKKYKCEILRVRTRLKKNLKFLLIGPMVKKRKALVALICFFYSPIRSIYRIKQLF